jgi:phosphoglycerate kinase
MKWPVLKKYCIILKNRFWRYIGGAKVSDKILIIETLAGQGNRYYNRRRMAYTFMKAEGGKIGKSLCEDDRIDTAKIYWKRRVKKNVCFHFPSDSTIADKFAADADVSVAPSNHIPEGWMGLDIGPNAITQFANVIHRSKTILWNGPNGSFRDGKSSNTVQRQSQSRLLMPRKRVRFL